MLVSESAVLVSESALDHIHASGRSHFGNHGAHGFMGPVMRSTVSQDTTSRYMGEQHRRLSDRLRIQRIPHEAPYAAIGDPSTTESGGKSSKYGGKM